MKKKIFFCLTAVLFLLSSCIVVQANSYEVGKNESRAYPLRDFSAIEVSGAIHVEFVQSNNQSYRVKAVGSHSMLPKLQMEVRNHVLIIKQKSDPGFHSGNHHLTVYVQSPNLQSVTASGACDVLIRSLNASAVRLEACGSSDVTVNQKIYISCSFGRCQLISANQVLVNPPVFGTRHSYRLMFSQIRNQDPK